MYEVELTREELEAVLKFQQEQLDRMYRITNYCDIHNERLEHDIQGHIGRMTYFANMLAY